MKHTMKLALSCLKGLLASAMLCAPALAGTTILDYGAHHEAPGGTLNTPAGLNTPYAEIIQPGDGTPVAISAIAPQVQAFQDFGPIALTDGATIEWTNVTAWNNDPAAGNAGSNYFAHADVPIDPNDPNVLRPDTGFVITTANPGDVVTVEGVGGFTRDALVGYGDTLGSPVNVPVYNVGVSGWSSIGTSTGSASGSLAVGVVFPDPASPEGDLGAMRITITPAGIPEPTSLALLGLAGFASLAIRRRK